MANQTNVNGNGTSTTQNKPLYNRGFITRDKADVEGRSAKGNCLELWVNQATQKTVQSTGDVVLELNMNGKFNNNNGVDYTLGKDVYANDEGLMYVQATAWNVNKDRLIKLNIRKGFLLRIYGVFEKEVFARNDGSQGASVRVKNIQQFEVVQWPKDGQNGNGNNAGNNTPASTPAPAAPTTPTNSTPVQNTAPANTAPATPEPPEPTTPNSATSVPSTPAGTEVEVPF